MHGKQSPINRLSSQHPVRQISPTVSRAHQTSHIRSDLHRLATVSPRFSGRSLAGLSISSSNYHGNRSFTRPPSHLTNPDSPPNILPLSMGGAMRHFIPPKTRRRQKSTRPNPPIFATITRIRLYSQPLTNTTVPYLLTHFSAVVHPIAEDGFAVFERQAPLF